ncbi:MAG: type II toxin-antitoxin system HicB family antitoxin [Rhizobium sp.]|nr:type II toxin-antitoxin system HicB family antitoxin [Rhizobium sp.]
MQNFIGLIHKDPNSDYGVSFPDFPGVATAGTDLDDARRMAEEALAFHVEGMIEDGEAIPEPSSLEAIMSDSGNSDAVAVLIPLRTPAKKAVRVNITLAEDLLRAIDAHAEAHGLTRSGFLARAAEQQMTSDDNPNNIRGYALSK